MAHVSWRNASVKIEITVAGVTRIAEFEAADANYWWSGPNDRSAFMVNGNEVPPTETETESRN